MQVFLRWLSQYWHGEVAEMAPWRYLSFFFLCWLLCGSVIVTAALGTTSLLCSCHHCLCGDLRDAGFFWPLLLLSLSPTPFLSEHRSTACWGIWPCPEPLAITQVSNYHLLKWCLGLQDDVVKSSNVFCSALAIKTVLRRFLFCHNMKQRWLLVTPVMSKLPR